MPKRIQRKRTKGWRMPAGAVYVGRGSKWGNPYKIGGEIGGAIDQEGLVGHFEDMLADPELMARTGYPQDFRELRGKDLACWCSLNEPCHADILLSLANDGDD